METLREAYQMAKRNDGAPGIDGVTFEAIEESGAESFLMQIREELDHRSLIIYTIMTSSILYFQRNTTGAALISSKY